MLKSKISVIFDFNFRLESLTGKTCVKMDILLLIIVVVVGCWLYDFTNRNGRP